MQQRSGNDAGKQRNAIDYLLYGLAGSALAAVSFSFLLWLRF